MKSQTTLANNINRRSYCKGFLLPEMMVAFSLMTIFLLSALILSVTMNKLHEQGVKHLETLEQAMMNPLSDPTAINSKYGNDTVEIANKPLTILSSDYANAWGRDSCSPRISFDSDNMDINAQGIDLGEGNISMDIEVRDKIAYIAADSATASTPDFYIVDMHDPTLPIILSSLNTGPGLSTLEVAGHYVYAVNKGTTNQLQIIDINDRNNPVLITKLKLPLPKTDTPPPIATSIFYSKGFIYLGTEKWDGGEFSIIDVTIPSSPHFVSGFETNTLVNDIYVRNGFAYLATPGQKQLRILDVHYPTNITEVDSFSSSGWETQTATTVSYFEDQLSIGRTTGGFNVPTNHEVLILSMVSPIILKDSHDIPGGVYGILMRPPYVYLATRSPGHEFQVWNSDLSEMVLDKSLGFLPQSIACDGHTMYFATGNQKGIATMEI